MVAAKRADGTWQSDAPLAPVGPSPSLVWLFTPTCSGLHPDARDGGPASLDVGLSFGRSATTTVVTLTTCQPRWRNQPLTCSIPTRQQAVNPLPARSSGGKMEPDVAEAEATEQGVDQVHARAHQHTMAIRARAINPGAHRPDQADPPPGGIP